MYENPFRFIPGPCTHCGVCAPLRTLPGTDPGRDGVCEVCDEILFNMNRPRGQRWMPWVDQFRMQLAYRAERRAAAHKAAELEASGRHLAAVG